MNIQKLALLLLTVASVSSLNAESVYLDGTWYIREGFDPSYTGIENAPHRVGPEGNRIPHYFLDRPFGPVQNVWQETQYPIDFSYWNQSDYKGWITLHYSFPASAIQPDSAGLEVVGDQGTEDLAIFTGFISDVSRIYVNGKLIGGLGSADPYANGSYMTYLETFPEALVAGSDTVHITIALYRGADYSLALRDSRLQMGRAAEVITWYYLQEILSFSLLSLYGAVGLYHLLLYARRRNEIHNLFFGLFCVGLTVYWFMRTGSRDLVFSNHILVRTSLEYSILCMLGPLLVLFFFHFLYGKYSRVGLGYSAFAGILALGILVSPYPTKNLLLNINNLTSVFMLFFLLYYIIRAALMKNKDAYYLLAGFILFFLGATHDILATFGVLNTPHVTRYAFVVFILGIAGTLANRFVRVHNQVEELNQNLEKKVEKRTEELQQSLQEIRALKVQQDGDYYLTSLLIKPLGGNFVEPGNVDIDILMRQKKQFQFRRWEADIGGDLIASHSIELQGKKYAAFVNGDAMGKSIQGAGGALVLGVVFKAVISRTQQSSEIQRLSPEKWLRICFEELQNVFVSFDGTMMISAVLGLVDEHTGMLYFINAEHPWTVLYRNQQATFLEDGLQLRKIGIEALTGKLSVQTFAMQPHDVIIVGSDGRDDIQLGVDLAGNRIINEDENEFLRRVEEGEGHLDRIEETILSTGALTDDFTLIRIAYKEDAPIQEDPDPNLNQKWSEIKTSVTNTGEDERNILIRKIVDLLNHVAGLQRFPSQADVLRDLAHTAVRLKDHTLAVKAYQLLLDRFPEDTDSLFRLSYQLKLTGDYLRAAEAGEQVRLRNRSMVKNLINLSDCHRLTGNLDRAKKILNEARVLEPENENVALLGEKLSDATGPAGNSTS
ncbi:MAG: stage II sporulation protein E [Spirochaetaceae bacterium]|nr:stage II sporulation protein E [Spirochaetaceae bacterium]MBU43393.1 stage II sporulation protein E [Spirochaetaceae bacterium]|tara:strand:- start:6210 stop:8879 length:2670 start_codon:yes stop_codon:yes gene_type:complete